MDTKEENEIPGAPVPLTEPVAEQPMMPPPPPPPPIENLGTIADAAPTTPIANPVETQNTNVGIPEAAPVATVEDNLSSNPPVAIPDVPGAPSQEDTTSTDSVPSPTAGAEKEEDFPVFLVVPSTFSYIFSIILILLMFLIYILSIGSIASFEGKFFPNVYMFWDFMTTGNTKQYQTEFENYMKNVLVTTQYDMSKVNEDSFVGSRSSQEGFSNYLGENVKWFDNIRASWSWFIREVQIMWNRILLNIMVRGNTIHVVR